MLDVLGNLLRVFLALARGYEGQPTDLFQTFRRFGKSISSVLGTPWWIS